MSSSITILLALVVFLLIVGETLPPTPDAIPVLGQSVLNTRRRRRRCHFTAIAASLSPLLQARSSYLHR